MSTTVSINGVAFLVQSGEIPQHDRFWMKVNSGVWETETYRVIDEQTDKDTLAIDCGGWIGPTILYTAQRCGYCVGFEPDPVAYATLKANLALNSDAPWAQNVKLVNKAIHSTGHHNRGQQQGGRRFNDQHAERGNCGELESQHSAVAKGHREISWRL